MARITVTPALFTLVDFDRARIEALAAETAEAVGLPADLEIHLEIDEATPFGRTSATVSGRRVDLMIEGGAFEDPKELRQLSEEGTRQVLGRLLFRVADRLDPDFGGVPPDDDLTLEQHAAWDAYAVGRYARMAGVDGARERRRYTFRLRHGFTDASDRAFDRLWEASDLRWADIESTSRETSTTGQATGASDTR